MVMRVYEVSESFRYLPRITISGTAINTKIFSSTQSCGYIGFIAAHIQKTEKMNNKNILYL